MSKQNKGNGIQIETENATTWILNKAFIPTGRIKRMRSQRESRYVNLAKRVGKRAYSFSGNDFPYPITRWTRH